MTKTLIVRRIKNKLKNKRGFTIAEMLFAVAIMGLATGLMARTVSVAFTDYEKITKKSEAQLLCNALVAAVQDELVYARDIDSAKSGIVSNPKYFSTSRDMGQECTLVAATYNDDGYTSGSLGEICVFSASGSASSDSEGATINYYPLVDHASYAAKNRVGMSHTGNYLTSAISYSWDGKRFMVDLSVRDGKNTDKVLSSAKFYVTPVNKTSNTLSNQ